MAITVAEIAARVGGAVEGDGDRLVGGLAGLREAGPGDLSFLANPRYAPDMETTRAGAVIVSRDWSGTTRAALIRAANPDMAFAAAAGLLSPPPPPPEPGVHPTAVVSPDARIGAGVCVGPHCVIEPGASIGEGTILGAGCFVGRDAALGEGCRLYPHVSVRERVRIGKRAILHNGAVIGSDGFGYVFQDGRWIKIPQVGTVELGDDVEIGANATVDRARFGRTVIGNGVKLDNLVQIAHNVQVGDHTAMAAQVGIAGSAVVGKNVQFGGQAGMVGHVHVGDRAIVAGKAGVTKDVPAGTFVSGFPAMRHDEARKLQACIGRLPELRDRVKAIEERLRALESCACEEHDK